MRICTWNVDHAKEGLLDVLRAELARHETDIWVLTETNDYLVPPNLGFVAHSGPRPEGVEGGDRHGSRWVSIWSRYPILHQVATLDKNNRTVAALVDAPCGRVLVYGTVLPWPGRPPRPTFSEAVAEQAAEWLRLGLAPRITLHGATTHELNLAGVLDVATEATIEAMAQSVAAGCRLLAKDDALVANSKNAG